MNMKTRHSTEVVKDQPAGGGGRSSSSGGSSSSSSSNSGGSSSSSSSSTLQRAARRQRPARGSPPELPRSAAGTRLLAGDTFLWLHSRGTCSSLCSASPSGELVATGNCLVLELLGVTMQGTAEPQLRPPPGAASAMVVNCPSSAGASPSVPEGRLGSH
ncbi:hypothetical protein E2C01_049053 [Portunus trituberculatus]|uniref:Uncharacterized protein n=1 Tax=Portunus trituberculatus TaxID=210409 RepID=A0A5B7G867_PORTR|nr:hypothetical protein [Portunus trituberculatus]